MRYSGKDGAIKVKPTTGAASAVAIGYIDSFNMAINAGTSETSQLGKPWKEWISTTHDWSGSLSGSLDYEDAVQQSLVDQILSGAITDLDCEFVIGKDLTITGGILITGITINMTHSDKISISVNFQGNGEPEVKAA